MLDEDRPHHSGGVDVMGRAPNHRFRQVLAPWPGMASTLNRVENHVRILSTVRIFETADAGSDPSFHRISGTLVSPRHTGCEVHTKLLRQCADRRERFAGTQPPHAASVFELLDYPAKDRLAGSQLDQQQHLRAF